MAQEDEIHSRIAALRKELAAIHQTNALYWEKQARNPGDQTDFRARVGRLQEILDELARLTECD